MRGGNVHDMALLAEWSAETSGAVPGVKGFCIGLSLGAGGVSSRHFDKHRCSCDRSNNSKSFPQSEFQQSREKTKEFNLLCKDTVPRML